MQQQKKKKQKKNDHEFFFMGTPMFVFFAGLFHAILYEPPHDKTNKMMGPKMIRAPSEDSDQV